MDRIGPTRMTTARTPKEFFFVVARFIALFWLELVAPNACSLFCTPPHWRFIWQ
jgi:hypothetical protein